MRFSVSGSIGKGLLRAGLSINPRTGRIRAWDSLRIARGVRVSQSGYVGGKRRRSR